MRSRVIAELSEPIDLLITDAVMPKMDGPELIVRLRASDPELPVLVVTGHIEPARWRRIEGLAGVHHLGKPFLPADLLLLTRELSRQQRAPAPCCAGVRGAAAEPRRIGRGAVRLSSVHLHR